MDFIQSRFYGQGARRTTSKKQFDLLTSSVNIISIFQHWIIFNRRSMSEFAFFFFNFSLHNFLSSNDTAHLCMVLKSIKVLKTALKRLIKK